MKKTALIPALAVFFAASLSAGWNDEPDDNRYRVVINHEEQYSVWFADRKIPQGWEDAGFAGSKKECLAHIEEVWTDIRPRTWRKLRAWRDWNGSGDQGPYQVVINHEEQYSVWFADRKLPTGWKDAGFSGTKKECLDYIEEVWTDMRPLSLRRQWE